ncbi:MAG: threonine/serine exporter family protein [Vulcanimicrobiota bacterium]
MTNVLLIFVATLALGIRFNLPLRTLPYSASIAAVSYFLASWLSTRGASPPEAAFAGAFAVAMISEVLARVLKVPSPVLSIPGVIPLVPGSVAYRAVVQLVKGQEVMGMELAIKAALTAVGIASGLLLASALSRQTLKPVFQVVLPSEHNGVLQEED